MLQPLSDITRALQASAHIKVNAGEDTIDMSGDRQSDFDATATHRFNRLAVNHVDESGAVNFEDGAATPLSRKGIIEGANATGTSML